MKTGRPLKKAPAVAATPAKTQTVKKTQKTAKKAARRSEPPARSVSLPPGGETTAPPLGDKGFCVVGLGASAGGLAALEEFFRHTPPDLGVAYVIVQHLDPGHKSIMVDLLARRTAMKVFQVTDKMRIEPNCVYVIPPNKHLALLHERLHLLAPDSRYPFRLPIDFFFRSLAEDRGDKSICIVLSGTGLDGSIGLKAVKAAGGMTMAQEEHTAQFDSMPRNAIATGCVDHILRVDQMAGELLTYLRHPYVSRLEKGDEAQTRSAGDVEKVFIVLRAHTGHDFSHYKRATTARRIERRMALHRITKIEEYVKYLRQTPTELDALFQELLIGVTSFFRDGEAFGVLEKQVIPRLFERKTPDVPIRVWVAGCSTGEEAYSVAILLKEEADRLGKPFKLQIFATDIDPSALDAARTGLYLESIASDLSPERLKRWFTKENGHYRLRQSLRDLVLFAKHDLLRDPPFSRLDLIVCRNLLIYLSSVLQRKILPLFHYTLNSGAFLMLGSSETIAEFADLFALVDKKWKIFQSKYVVRPAVDLPAMPLMKTAADPQQKSPKALPDRGAVQNIDKLLLEGYAPPCVIVNERYEIVHFRGRTGRYLEPAAGEASLHILRMAREGLRIPLRTALHKAFKDRISVFQPKVRVETNGSSRTVNLSIRPLDEGMLGLMLVVFEDITSLSRPEIRGKSKRVSRADQHLAELERELNITKTALQSTVEELETSNEELKSTNEELQSTNEELQSTNEELETSKEELQSINEELVTVNAELQSKVDELSQTNDDVVNMLSSTDIGTIFLDERLRIKRFTPAISRLFHLLPSDCGRPISHIMPEFINQDIVHDAENVLHTLVFKEQEVLTKTGGWYLMRIMPYRTFANVIEGVVVTFVDVSELKKQKLVAEHAQRYAEGIVAAIKDPLMVLDRELRVISANEAYYRTFQVEKEATKGRLVYDLGNGEWNVPELRKLLEEILPHNTSIEGFEVERAFDRIGRKTITLDARRIVLTQEDHLILLTFHDLSPTRVE